MPQLVPLPSAGRTFRARRRVRLGDTDAAGRLRLDAVARWLQDVAADDVEDAGWGSDEHVWIVRRTRIDVMAPVGGDEWVELETWCSGVAGSAAARRTSLRGEGGGSIQTETVWIHLDREGRPLRLSERFQEQYAPAAAGRRISTRLELPDPSPGALREPWPLRATDVDTLGHVNNAAYWEAVEELLQREGRTAAPLTAIVEHVAPIDLGERVELVRDGELGALTVGGAVRARIKA